MCYAIDAIQREDGKTKLWLRDQMNIAMKVFRIPYASIMCIPNANASLLYFFLGLGRKYIKRESNYFAVVESLNYNFLNQEALSQSSCKNP